MMRAHDIKHWCEDNLSPLAWSRILTKNLPHFNERGYYLQDLRDPVPEKEIVFDEATIQLINNCIKDLYHKEFSA